MIQFLSDSTQLAERSAKYGNKNNKLVRVDTPVVTFVLATHPDSTKVKKWTSFQRLNTELTSHWKANASQPIDIAHWLPLFTLDVLGLTVFSRNFNAMSGEQDADVDAVSLILSDLQSPHHVARTGKLN